MRAGRQYCLLVMKDIRRELRTRELIGSMALYAVLLLLVLGVAVSQAGNSFQVLDIAGGLVWLLIVFSSLLGLGRSFAIEREAGALEGLMLAPLDRGVVFLAKATTNLLFLGAVECVTLPAFFFLFLMDAEVTETFWLSVVPLVVGSVGVAAVGTFFAGITTCAHGGDVLLAVLFVPVAFPLLYACVAATGAALVAPVEWETTYTVCLALAVGFDAIMIAVAWLLYGYVLDA